MIDCRSPCHFVRTEEERVLSLPGQWSYASFRYIVVYTVTPVVRVNEDLFPEPVKEPDGFLHQFATWRVVVGKQYIHLAAQPSYNLLGLQALSCLDNPGVSQPGADICILQRIQPGNAFKDVFCVRVAGQFKGVPRLDIAAP